MNWLANKHIPKKGIDIKRRKFLVDSVRTACGVSLFGLGIGLYSQQAASLPTDVIRPPGALPEDEFLAACSRCGLCVRDCPYDILKLAELGEKTPVGTPYYTARTGPCEMCEDVPCVPACPTGALDHSLTNIKDAQMGLAVLIDQEACIAFQGLRCEVCFNVCPIRGDAITLNYEHNERSGKHARLIPIVHSNACTGCGLCEEACILDEAAIKVIPTWLAKGELGKHYRLGWEKKSEAGKSLVTPDAEHRYNLPEGMEYDHGGEGLILNPDDSSVESPFSSNPLDTLNQSSLGQNKSGAF